MTMTMTENKCYHDQEVTKLKGSVIGYHGYRMDVNLWFRHKNEALFYLDSVGKVHGPMDQTYSIRLGPVEKSSKEIALKKSFSEENEKEKWRTYNEFQNNHPNHFQEETKHIETMLTDVSSNKVNNYQKSFLTTATHYIPKPSHVEVGNYSTSITKNNTRQGVIVNLKASVEDTEDSMRREKRLIDELLETKNELNTLRRTKSVIDTNLINDHSFNNYDEKYVSKVVTDVQPTMEKVRTQHLTTRQENINKDLPKSSQISSIQNSKNYVENHSVNSDTLNRNILNQMRLQQMYDKPSPQPIPVTFSTSSSRSKDNHVESSSSVSRSISVDQEREMIINPVQSIARVLTSQDDEEQDMHQEEKTVTIKRKITRRKKASEKVNHLRDSYIEKISSSLPTYDSTSDSDKNMVNNAEPIVSEVIPIKQASVFQRPPPIIESSPINEEFIVPQKKGTISSSISFEFMKNPGPNENPSSEETYINQKQMAPVSTYSARKENIKSQQLLNEKNFESKILQPERIMGHRNEVTEEIETITLQPIGKGVQDLTSNTIISRSGSKVALPRASDSGTNRSNYYREESKQIGNYNTMPAMPKFAKANSVRNVNQMSNNDLRDLYKRGNSVHRVGNEQTQNISFTNERIYNGSFTKSSTNEQSQHIPFNRSAQNNQAYNTSVAKSIGNAKTLNTMSNRPVIDQTINTSWHTRNESFGGNHGYQSQMSPLSNQESFSSNIIVIPAEENQRINLQIVINSEEQWYKPNFSREDVMAYLNDKEPGSFFIRNSSTFSGAYGLALKVNSLPDNAIRTNDSEGDLVRHFLIETVEDVSGNGVRLKGFTNESVYPTLAHFVHAHCENAIALPINLILSQSAFTIMNYNNGMTAKSQYQFESHQQQLGSSKAQLLSQSHRSLSSPGVNFKTLNHPNPLHQNFLTNAVYLGKIEIDRLTGDTAIEHAVDKIMAKSSLKTSTVEIELDSTKGITLNDKMQKLFYTRKFPAQHILYAGFDPKQREFFSPLLQSSGINRGKIMGIVVKKQKMILQENIVHLFCEIDGMNNLNDVLVFVKENYFRRI